MAGVVVAALAMAGCSSDQGSGEAASTDATLNLASWIEPISFDPSQAQDGYYIPFQQAVYDTLVRQMPDGTFAPMLAKSWSFDDAKRALTLKLRDDVKFTDGSVLDSSVVKANIEHFRNANGPQKSTVASVASIDAPDATTVVLNLSQPDPGLLFYLSNVAGYMASAKALSSPDLATVPVGSGPYTLEASSTVKGSQYTFERNPDYWGDKLPYKTIVFKILPDANARLNALKSGQVSSAVLGDAKSAAEAAKSGLSLIGKSAGFAGMPLFDRGGTVTPALGDVRVRQAINYAIDRQGILDKILLGYGTATSQIFPEGFDAYQKDLDNAYPFDPEKAKKLLSEAGYAQGLTLELPTVSIYDPSLKAIIAQQLSNVGITVKWTELPASDFLAALRSGKYSATYMNNLTASNDWATASFLLTPNAPFNPFKSTDATAGALLQTMRTGSDAEKAEAAKKLNQHIVDQAWFAPFYRSQILLAVKESDVAVTWQNGQTVPSIYNYKPAAATK